MQRTSALRSVARACELVYEPGDNKVAGMVQFIDLWRGHPINESVQTPCIAPRDLVNLEGKSVSKGLPVFANQCAIRMGVALQRAGVTAAQLPGCAHCAVQGRDEMHFINAQQLAQTIDRARLPSFGPRETIREPTQYYHQVFGRTGVMFIADYWGRATDQSGSKTGDHIDVWNGYRSSAKWLMEWFSWAGYYSNYAGAREMWFWEVK